MGLTACGGGGVDAVYANGNLPPVSITGFAGATFPMEVAVYQETGGAVDFLDIQVYSISITSPTTAVVETDLGTVEVTEAGGVWAVLPEGSI
ncbi:MAG: hypothetical protein OXQ92_03245 [Boseongicola sp.]|nr:hypothetical protein [Boseongicola sp.]